MADLGRSFMPVYGHKEHNGECGCGGNLLYASYGGIPVCGRI